MTVPVNDNEILLSGFVGDSFFDDGFTLNEVVDALASVGRGTDIVVRLNSGGGLAQEGVAIFNALKAHRGNVDLSVEAIAASAASIIAMGGDRITMRTGAVMMIHDPMAFTVGTAADHEKSVEMLDVIAISLADVYAERTGLDVKEVRADMKAETWLTSEEAVERGYADVADDEADGAAEATAFNYQLYNHAPDRIAALADANGWNKRQAVAAGSARPKRNKETTMPKTEAELAAEATAAVEKATAAAAKVTEDKATAHAAGVTMGQKKGAEEATAVAAEISQICADAGLPKMAAALIKSGATVEDTRSRVDGAKEIHAAVALAGKTNPAIKPELADTYLAEAKTLEEVRADLFTKMAGTQKPVDASHSTVDPAGQQVVGGWDKQVEKANARLGNKAA